MQAKFLESKRVFDSLRVYEILQNREFWVKKQFFFRKLDNDERKKIKFKVSKFECTQ